MLAREYNKRISVYQVEDVPDGYGGNTVVKTVLAESWAQLVNGTKANQRATGLGITDIYEPLIFKLRYRNDLPYNGRNLYLSYQGEEYVIKSITDNNEFHREIEILCTKTIPETVPLIVIAEPLLLAPSYTILGDAISFTLRLATLEDCLASHAAEWMNEGFPDAWVNENSIYVLNNADGNVYFINNVLYPRLIEDNDLTLFDELLEEGSYLQIPDSSLASTTDAAYTSMSYLDADNNLKLIYKTEEGNVIIDHPAAP